MECGEMHSHGPMLVIREERYYAYILNICMHTYTIMQILNDQVVKGKFYQ